MTDLIQPIINLNGMSAEEHVTLRVKALTALHAAMDSLSELRPHGRDYIGDDQAYQRDLSIYSERFRQLDALHNAIMDEAVAIKERS